MDMENSSDWLPAGLTEKFEGKNGKKVKNNADESSANCVWITNIGGIQEGNEDNSPKMLDKMYELSPLDSPQSPSMENIDHRTKKKRHHFIPIASERSTDDELPGGWIKEVVTSICGGRSRKDPYYTDPVSGYVFRSKQDALRYITTNDVCECAIQPKKRESTGLNQLEHAVQIQHSNETTPVKNTPNIKIQVAVERSTVDELPPGWFKEVVTRKSGRKDPYYTDPVSRYAFRSKPDALRYLQTNDIRSCANRPCRRLNLPVNGVQSSSPAAEKIPEHPRWQCDGVETSEYDERPNINFPANSDIKVCYQTIGNKDSTEANRPRENNPNKDSFLEPENKALNDELGLQPPETEKKHLPNLKRRTKIKDPILHSRTLKRPAAIESEARSNVGRASLRPSTIRSSPSNGASPPSEYVVAGNKTPVKTEPPGPENPPNRALFIPGVQMGPKQEPQLCIDFGNSWSDRNNETPVKTEPPGPENPPNRAPFIPGVQTGPKQEPQLCIDFGDSWSDPLRFALKTLTGEITMDESLAVFAGCFDMNQSLAVSREPDIFLNDDIAPGCGSSMERGVVDPLQAISSAPGNVEIPSGFSNFGGLPNSGAWKNVGQRKADFFNP